MTSRVPGVAVRPLTDRRLGSRTVEAVLPAGPGDPAVDRFLAHLVTAARARVGP